MAQEEPLPCNWPVYVGWSSQLNCRGVFAARDIKKDELIEPCPIILIPYENQQRRLDSSPTGTILDNYYYDWNKNFWCIPLGYAVLYNHSYEPNAVYKYNHPKKLISYMALKDISQDEEITVNYNGDPKDKDPIESWFSEFHGRKII
jgi:uncharacterized protein